MTEAEIIKQIRLKKSFLCIGLDTDIRKIPCTFLKRENPIFAFNQRIIDATAPFAVAYKPNIAFYESLGTEGWKCLELTVEYLKKNYPDIFIIADAKRGDIGNTSSMYARTFFENMDFDAITVAPYMGKDSVTPFLEYPEKWAVVLALTSNPGADDFQFITDKQNKKVFEHVLQTSKGWGNTGNMMFVVGATKASLLVSIREIVPDHFLLVPGVGAQGGSLADVAKYGMTKDCRLLVNSSRAIIYADTTDNFANIAGEKAKEVQQEMEKLLVANGVI